MRHRIARGAAALLLGGAALSALAAQPKPSDKAEAAAVRPNVRAGLWRIGVAMEVTPAASGPATGPAQTERCMIPEDMKSLLQIPPGGAAQCRIEDQRLTADVLTWSLTCRQGGYTAVANGRIEFKGSTMQGRIVTDTLGTNVRMTTTIAGRYVGECVSTQPKEGAADAPRGPTIVPARPGERLPRYMGP